LENPYKLKVEISQACGENKECYAKLRILDDKNDENLRLIYRVSENDKKEIIYKINNVIVLHIRIRAEKIEEIKYYPSKPDPTKAKIINFYLDQICEDLRQQSSYLFF